MYYFRKQMKNITFSFEEFIQKLKKETIFNDLILKIKNKFVCDYHIRFENLKEGIKNVCDICEIKNYDLNNLPKFHSDSRPKNLNYRDVHNKKTKNIIAKLYSSYIKEFNYEY